MDGPSYVRKQYKLRSAGLNNVDSGRFIVQTFGLDEYYITVWPATTTLPESDDFAGYKVYNTDSFVSAGRAPYSSASFQRLPYLKDGTQVFSGQTTSIPKYDDDEGNLT